MLKTNTIVISAFGREHNLVDQLKKKNIEVTVFDLTDALSAEGLPVLSPFGWFGEASKEKESFGSFADVYSFEEVEQGFSLLTPSGPLEFRGPVFDKQWKNYGFTEAQKQNKVTSDRSYNKNWLMSLSHKIFSVAEVEFPQSLDTEGYVPLLNSYYRGTRRRLQRENHTPIKWFEISGYINDQIGHMDFLRENSEERETIEGKEWVLLLSRIEMDKLDSGRKFFKSLPAEPEWIWVPWEVKHKSFRLIAGSPTEFLALWDKELSLTHENLLWVQRWSDEEMTIWTKLPYFKSKDSQHMSAIRLLVLKGIQRWWPSLKIEECLPTSQEVPLESHWAVTYDPEKLKLMRQTPFKNFSFCGLEALQTFDPRGMLREQEKAYKRIVSQNVEGKR